MALDTETINALESLSKKWGVSKAEVMRRSIKKTNEKENQTPNTSIRTPLEALLWLKENGITKEEAESYKAELKLEREAWKDPWENNDTSGH